MRKRSIFIYCREALTNIRKHSNASEITVVIKEHPKYLTLTIKDNGTLNQEVKKEWVFNL